jgi:hypothetical protein
MRLDEAHRPGPQLKVEGVARGLSILFARGPLSD